VSAFGVKRAGGRARAKRKICNYCRSTFGAAHAHGPNTTPPLTDWLTDWRYSFPIFNNIISSHTCRHRRRRVCAPSLVAPCFTILFFFSPLLLLLYTDVVGARCVQEILVTPPISVVVIIRFVDKQHGDDDTPINNSVR